MPIVTGYEDTPSGHDALVLGAQLARLTGMRAVVASVYPEDGRGVTAVARDPRWRERTETIARERFARARARIDAHGYGEVEPEFRWLGPASPHTALADHADEVGAAFLVVGSTGHGLAGKLAPGGTVQRLLPTATCPVAVAPRGHRHFATDRITAVSVAYDGSPAAAGPRCGSSPSPRPPSSAPPPRRRCCGASPVPRRRSTRSRTWSTGRWDRRWPTCPNAPTCS